MFLAVLAILSYVIQNNGKGKVKEKKKRKEKKKKKKVLFYPLDMVKRPTAAQAPYI